MKNSIASHSGQSFKKLFVTALIVSTALTANLSFGQNTHTNKQGKKPTTTQQSEQDNLGKDMEWVNENGETVSSDDIMQSIKACTDQKRLASYGEEIKTWSDEFFAKNIHSEQKLLVEIELFNKTTDQTTKKVLREKIRTDREIIQKQEDEIIEITEKLWKVKDTFSDTEMQEAIKGMIKAMFATYGFSDKNMSMDSAVKEIIGK